MTFKVYAALHDSFVCLFVHNAYATILCYWKFYWCGLGNKCPGGHSWEEECGYRGLLKT